MSRRSRRHGRNVKKGTSVSTAAKRTGKKTTATAAIKRNSLLHKKEKIVRGRGRWKKINRIVKAKAKAQTKSMKQQNEPKEEASPTIKQEVTVEPETTTQSVKNDVNTNSVDTDVPLNSDDPEPKVPVHTKEPSFSDEEEPDDDDDDDNLLIVDEDRIEKSLTTDDESEAAVETSKVYLETESESFNSVISKKQSDSAMALASHSNQHSMTNQIHKCLVCGKILSSASSLDRHMLVHSGERPFKCKFCDMAFTTNGNMHRHMRTHGDVPEMAEITKGVDLSKREAVKRKLSLESSSQDVQGLAEQDKLLCPVCGKSLLCKYGLQSHMETHPNDPILCQTCGEISTNYTVHINHKCNAEKRSKNCKSVCSGFQDLNFMDFSTSKFSLVSKSFCEQNVKRPSSAFHVFECSECKKAFPCSRALKLHMNSHGNKSGTFCASCDCNFAGPAFLQLHQLKHRLTENCVWKSHCGDETSDMQILADVQTPHAGKEDFLALFNLQTKQSQLSLLKGLKECRVKEGKFENMDYFVHGKIKNISKPQVSDDTIDNNNNNGNNNDFADIQSIITLTSRATLIKDVHTSPVAVRSISPITIIPSQQPESPQEADAANSSPETPSINSAVQPVMTESVPDIAPVIFNSIYSCKICNQKFRTLNTLKRHSKMHVQRGSNYSCHLCSYVSVDKSTLIRHLRTHNGERPFQCTICKYAFTTKANCERHVRKRHKKLSKPEIRNCMQYNPNMALKAPDLPSSEISNSETVCKYCNVDFKFNRVLRHHLRSLHNSCNRKPFNCKICKFGFSTKNNCIRHVLKQHPSMKDKLRAVVIPNPQKIPREASESETEPVAVVDSKVESPTSVPTSEEQCEPLNLNCRLEEQPLDLCTETAASNAVANEAVIAAESLVSLAETLIPQEEPLDLALRPLDLSCKSQPLLTENSNGRHPNLSGNRHVIAIESASLLNLSTPNRQEPSHERDNNSRDVIEASSTEICSTPCTTLYPSVQSDSSRSFSQKLRAFTCIYCSAGFTLKSNMERHIKRKHPEYARPTRSRNFIPTVVAHRSQRNNVTMLSDKTRDALRHVLNTKVQHNVLGTKIYGKPTISTSLESIQKATYAIRIDPTDDSLCSNQSICATDLSTNHSSQSLDETEAETISSPNMCTDENSSDLASVSSVICMANSQQFGQYFEKPPSEKDEDISPISPAEEEEELPANSESNIACPFCSRKFPWSSSLRRHILTHTGQKPYKCPRCALWFTTKSNCERHLIRKHGHRGELIYRTVPDRPYKCNQCPSSTFSTQGNLRKHFYLKHWTKSYLGMNTKVCTKRDSKERDKDEPGTETISTVNITRNNEEHSYSQVKKKHFLECHFCTQKFDEISHLSKHMQKHDHVTYMCYLCRKMFPTSDNCYSHFKTSHSLVYQQISHHEVNPSIMVAKIKSKTDEASPTKGEESTAMACMICFQKISSLDGLQQHVKKHLQIYKGNTKTREKPASTSAQKSLTKTDSNVSQKRIRLKKKVQNSLLYFLTPSTIAGASSTISSSSKSVEGQGESSNQEDGSDLIQNLLGIHDSKIIDEMLVSADSAARLLGVKKV